MSGNWNGTTSFTGSKWPVNGTTSKVNKEGQGGGGERGSGGEWGWTIPSG